MVAEVFLRQARPSFDRLYHYEVPEALRASLVQGMQVLVPFGRGDALRPAFVRRLVAADELEATAERPAQLKAIDSLVEPFPLLREDQLQLVESLAIRYACSRGDAARLMLPALTEEGTGPGGGRLRMIALVDREQAIALLESGELRHINQIRVLDFLLDAETAVPAHDLLQACQVSESTLTTLRKKGWVEAHWLSVEEQATAESDPFAAEAVTDPDDFVLTHGQAAALERLQAAYRGRTEGTQRIREFLLQGITGSGKTEVYLRLASEVVAAGQDVIILVPEIALTPLMSERIRQRFGDAVAIQHSRLTPRERQRQWERIRSGEVSVVVGARSAIFSPVSDLGLVVIDEEQESTYRSDRNPRYDARSVARLRVRDRAALCVLGSATPSLVSRQRCDRGRAQLLRLDERAGSARLPSVRIVDLRLEGPQLYEDMFTETLLEAMAKAFEAGDQVMLFHNRRGWSGLEICASCGFTIPCEACSVAMTLHRGYRGRPDNLQCHYCGLVLPVPDCCPACGEDALHGRGFGTEQIEAAFARLFPTRRLLRMDQDTTSGRHSHASILGAFRRREADCLLGTQMIAKGHDFPDVTLMGVLLADQLFHGNDYAAAERGFQLLTQAAGRAGRADRPGQVIIQAWDSEHEALACAVEQDYERFYRSELRVRSALHYPPFTTMGTITVRHISDGGDERAALAIAEQLPAQLQRQGIHSVRILPPLPAQLRRLNNRSRWQIHLSAPRTQEIAWLFQIASRVRLDRDSAVGLAMDPA